MCMKTENPISIPSFFSLPFHYDIAYGDEKKFLINFAQISNNQWF